MKNSPFIKWIYFGFLGVIILIVLNIVYLGVTGIHFASKVDIRAYASGRGVKEVTLYSKRGNIYTSDKELVATDVSNYKLIAYLDKERFAIQIGAEKVPAHVVDIEDTANKVAPILGMPVAKMIEILSQEGKYQVEFGQYGSNITSVQKDRITALSLPGLDFNETSKRYYPFGEFLSYQVGYSKFYDLAEGKKQVGEMGLELVLNDQLSGKDGKNVYQTDSSGYTLPNSILNSVEAVDGNDVYLTVNSNLQRELEVELDRLMDVTGAEENWGIILDMKTGKVLAMSSKPGFDANNLDISRYYDTLLSGKYEPGSTIKPFTILSAMNSGTYDGNATYDSTKYDILNGDGSVAATVTDWYKKGWGHITYDTGLIRSSNTGMCNILKNFLKAEDFWSDLRKVGFDTEYEFDGLSTASGEIVEGNQNEYFNSFGQGITVTPMQLVKAYTVFANNGRTVDPYIVDYIKNPTTGEIVYSGKSNYSDQIFSTESLAHVSFLMKEAVNNTAIGSGTAYHIEGMTIMGKTGTASYSKPGGTGYYQDRNVYSFVGVTDYENPRYLVYLASRQSSARHPSTQMGITFNRLVASTLHVMNEYDTTDSENGVKDIALSSYTNQSTSFAKNSLAKLNISYYIIGDGEIIVSQLPLAYSTISTNEKVFLKTNSTASVSMINMKGWTRKEVAKYCQLVGIDVEYIGLGYVTGQNIMEGTIIQAGDVLQVTLQ